ncbi:hypothetical protein BpHYR1_031558 [Brachionus plicatilis]|uniref:Uncharacterized protein n=1 Tax=Brachionus plicatilis TaxID=10195 RepID=A0A3M7PXA0_BRAPC|nr:hypothetical protein BpHYR1_031558 [Brachionus plicatilis]
MELILGGNRKKRSGIMVEFVLCVICVLSDMAHLTKWNLQEMFGVIDTSEFDKAIRSTLSMD